MPKEPKWNIKMSDGSEETLNADEYEFLMDAASQRVRLIEVRENLTVNPAFVVKIVRRMVESGLSEYQPGSHSTSTANVPDLTPEERAKANKMIDTVRGKLWRSLSIPEKTAR